MMSCRRFLAVATISALTTFCAIGAAQQKTPAAAPSGMKPGSYVGPGGCAASNCHGSVQPKTVTRIPQNEYSIWAGQDKHARAYQVLSNAVSVRIGKILNIGRPDQSQKCLACHALSVPTEQRAETFEYLVL